MIVLRRTWGVLLITRGATQLLTTPLSYLTEDDWLKITAPDATANVIMTVSGERYSKVGVRN